ncbi:Uncharacterised protein [Mycobacterium tuberculosis]|nr:Uncharacterised protein [Mycobacterium tuberculosis]
MSAAPVSFTGARCPTRYCERGLNGNTSCGPRIGPSSSRARMSTRFSRTVIDVPSG